MTLVYVLLDVALWKLSITYFFIARFLGRFGTTFYNGLVFLWFYRSLLHIISPIRLWCGGPRVRHAFFSVIWFANVWEIWKERNNGIFNGKDCSILRLVDKIKLLSFSWLKEKFVQFSLNYHGWWLSPLAMLGYG